MFTNYCVMIHAKKKKKNMGKIRKIYMFGHSQISIYGNKFKPINVLAILDRDIQH